ncbi:unnamed protein product [Vitrella brassicaformis CCMP3155]|uniref:Uncharacterized protein n=2 Tax=Vitrella brassicaformis TaxID=1169539 RepID=A0A0G4EC47_VITBC|nr:unnamed protein product [Vitrella brassicaformis CCMP3155]|mmetsp:Transcript_4339/g.9914  ORF Transcript_4339/g.9914 Transcript_4339/m.9914 type:complete len:311 (+) Transcript_4339:83-1015(+)|eukprot:CEL93261.1 unnamed protein product [Vitrella brassicaformis CCMP3155]
MAALVGLGRSLARSTAALSSAALPPPVAPFIAFGRRRFISSLVIADVKNGDLTQGTRECIAAAQQMGEVFDVLVAGPRAVEGAKSAAECDGVRTVLLVTDDRWPEFGDKHLVDITYNIKQMAVNQYRQMLHPYSEGRDMFFKLLAKEFQAQAYYNIIKFKNPTEFTSEVKPGKHEESKVPFHVKAMPLSIFGIKGGAFPVPKSREESADKARIKKLPSMMLRVSTVDPEFYGGERGQEVKTGTAWKWTHTLVRGKEILPNKRHGESSYRVNHSPLYMSFGLIFFFGVMWNPFYLGNWIAPDRRDFVESIE